MLLAAERALLEGGEATVAQSIVTLAIHLQLLAKPREEVLAPFFPAPLRALLKERKADTHGNHLKWADGDVLIDFSAVFANGIFLRHSCQFAGHPPLEQILTKVRNNEDALFAILGVQEASHV